MAEKTKSQYSPAVEKSTKDIMGKDTYERPDSRRTIWPESSQGRAAEKDVARGKKPSEVVAEYEGKRKGDIELKPSKRRKRPTPSRGKR